jgi:hypothetical protein
MSKNVNRSLNTVKNVKDNASMTIATNIMAITAKMMFLSFFFMGNYSI